MNSVTSDTESTSARGQITNITATTDPKQYENEFVISACRRNKDTTTNETLNAQHEPTEESDIEEKLLVVYCRSAKLGAAYFTLQNGELFILEEIADRPPDFQIFASLFRQVEPFTILLDGKDQGSFVQVVKKTVFDNDSKGEKHCKIIFLSAREYSFEACKRRIHLLALPNEPPNCTDDERILFLRTVINFSQSQSVHALGALLRFVDLHWSTLSMDLHGKPQFLNLRTISLNDIVTIDGDSYRGLQIFSTVSHPSNYRMGVQGTDKEGFSLFRLFNKCNSTVGHSKMRVLMQHPIRDLGTLKRRQDVIQFFIRPQNEPIMRNICSPLRFIKNVNGILAKIKALSAKPYQWKSLYNTLYNAVLICEMCEQAGKASEFLEDLASFDNHKLYEMALYMNRIIDFDLSRSEGKFTVKAGVDPELDIKKQTMASLHGLMSESAKVELDRLPNFIEECMMVYMPHLGYLLAVKSWTDQLTPTQKELPNMKFMFQNNEYIHYKTKGCEELDVMIGDTYPEIVAHETRIMMRLTAVILENLHTLDAVIEKCAELDCLISIAKVCKEYNYIRPVLTDEKIISIKQGKHPLHMITCDTFVPNDAESSEETGCVKILTGPNSSGKSVYMKQIGLIVYLAHIGSFVPCESAKIGILTHIFTRVHSPECVASHMSAFLTDLKQMSTALQECTGNSLLLVDEFGKGTSECDGLTLLAACLNTLLFKQHCPHVLLSTHFLNIREYIIDTPLVTFLRFEYVIQDGEPVFLYRVCEGSADASFAKHAAAAAGVNSRIIQRADTIMDCIRNNKLPPMNTRIKSKVRKAIQEIIKTLLEENI